MGIPRAHHYIPQFYLDRFADPIKSKAAGKSILWVYEQKRQIRKSTPKNEAHQRDFYAYEEAGEKKQDIEKALGQIESHIAPILRKTDAPDYFFAEAEKLAMASFVALMFTRVPSHREYTDNLFGQFLKTWLQEKSKDPEKFKTDYEAFLTERGPTEIPADDMRNIILEGKWEVEQTSSAFNLGTMTQMSMDLTPVIFSLGWEIWHTDSDQLFLTSDNPVITSLPGNASMSFGMGFGIPGVEVIFPLSARACLVMKGGAAEGSAIVTNPAVRDINKRVMVCARRYLYAPEFSSGVAKLFDNLGAQVVYGENAFLPASSPALSKADMEL